MYLFILLLFIKCQSCKIQDAELITEIEKSSSTVGLIFVRGGCIIRDKNSIKGNKYCSF